MYILLVIKEKSLIVISLLQRPHQLLTDLSITLTCYDFLKICCGFIQVKPSTFVEVQNEREKHLKISV